MSKLPTRRSLVTAGLATAAGASTLGAAVYFAGRHGLIPPDYGGIYGVGETLTYATQRLLTSGQPLAREFKHSEISKVAIVNGPAPEDETYRALLADGFKDWRLQVEGLVARPTFRSKSSSACPRKVTSCCTPARKAGPTLPNRLACASHTCSISSKRDPRRDMSRSSPMRTATKIRAPCAYCGTASTWPKPFIRKLSSPMA